MTAKTNVLIILPPSENGGDVYGRALRERFPELDITWVHDHSEVDPHVADAHVILTFSPFMARHVAEKARNLRWLQILGSGMDGITDLPFHNEVVVANGHGVQAVPVSEGALSLMLVLARGLDRVARNQTASSWERWPPQLLHDKTVGILGVGAIAEALAPKCKAMGMRVIGVSAAPREIPGFDSMVAKTDLMSAVVEMDFLVLLTPHTPQSHHMVGEAVLAAMKPTAYLVNVARGGVVDEAALIRALEAGVIAGAALDVFETEPLPKDSPLWAMPNVFVSPHLAGVNDSYARHIMPLLETNFRAFLSGDRSKMRNVWKRD